jgi:hypothetical protein
MDERQCMLLHQQPISHPLETSTIRIWGIMTARTFIDLSDLALMSVVRYLSQNS